MGLLRALGKIIGLLLLLLVILLIPLSVWLYNLQLALFSPATYQDLLNTESLYTQAIPAMMTSILDDEFSAASNPAGESDIWFMRQLLSNATRDQRTEIMRILLPADWLQEQLTGNMNALFIWLGGPGLSPDFKIDTTVLREQLVSEETDGMIRAVVIGWPSCTANQTTIMEAQIAGDFSTSGTFTACNPRGEVGDALEAKMIDSFTFLGESLPDNLPREPRPELTPARQAQLLNLKVGIRATRRIAFLIFLFPLIPLLFIQILTVRSFRSFLGWYGWGLLGGGLLSLLILIDLIPLGLTNVIFGGNALDPANVQFIVVLLAVVHKITQPILMMGGIIAGVGLIFVIFAFILPHPPEEIVEETTEYFGQPEGQAGG